MAPVKILQTKEEVASLQQHLKEILEGDAFKGSHRSGQFLAHIVEQSIAGEYEALKERIIGVKLFGRDPSYDTGEDAIVRVTASDVRKRLLQHYGRYGSASEWQIRLPLGSYIPEISRNSRDSATLRNPVALSAASPTSSPAPLLVSQAPRTDEPAWGHGKAKWIVLGSLLAGLNLAMWVAFWVHSSQARSAEVSMLPWSALFHSQRGTDLIASDPNIAEIQGLTGFPISVSDYANQHFIPHAGSLSPQLVSFCKEILRGDKAAAVDARIIGKIAELAQTASSKIDVHVARDIQLSNLYVDDNLILLGSPRSNPWSALFDQQLDFRFVFDTASQQEIIRNVRPRAGELASYVPTAKGWATGQSYATISFIQNPGKDGQVLLLAGANAEGTAAAGDLVTNRQRLTAALEHCGILSANPVKHFQLLLRLNTMAGSPSDVDVLACHLLPGSATH